MDGFGAKLELVLKALSLSRARLAADLAVDKSLVGRWVAGTVKPSDHSLSRLTQYVAGKRPGFTELDWDRDLAALELVLKATSSVASGIESQDAIALTLPASIAAATRARSGAFEGFWRITFSPGASDRPNVFLYSFVYAYKAPGGLLRYRAGTMGAELNGWCLPMGTQLTTIGVDSAKGTISMQVFNAPAIERLVLMDGIYLTWRDGVGGAPLAGACVIERVGDLSGDMAKDEAQFEVLLTRSPVADDGAVSDVIRQTLLRDIGPTAAAAGGDLLLTLPFIRSIARA